MSYMLVRKPLSENVTPVTMLSSLIQDSGLDLIILFLPFISTSLKMPKPLGVSGQTSTSGPLQNDTFLCPYPFPDLHVDVPHVAEGEGRPEGGEAGHRRPLAVVPGHRC